MRTMTAPGSQYYPSFSVFSRSVRPFAELDLVGDDGLEPLNIGQPSFVVSDAEDLRLLVAVRGCAVVCAFNFFHRDMRQH